MKELGYEVSGVNHDAAERLAVICQKHDGTLTRSSVLEDARDPKSPLHKFFTWDDSEAAEAHRLNQAGSLIRRVKVRIIGGEVETRAYVVRRPQPVALATEETDEEEQANEFAPVTSMTEEDQQRRLLEEIRGDIERLRKKYLGVEAFFVALREALEDPAA